MRPDILPTDLPFYWLAPGDIVEKLGGSVIIFIEGGGLLIPSGGGCLMFVKHGGRVADGGGAPGGLDARARCRCPRESEGGRNVRISAPHPPQLR